MAEFTEKTDFRNDYMAVLVKRCPEHYAGLPGEAILSLDVDLRKSVSGGANVDAARGLTADGFSVHAVVSEPIHVDRLIHHLHVLKETLAHKVAPPPL